MKLSKSLTVAALLFGAVTGCSADDDAIDQEPAFSSWVESTNASKAEQATVRKIVTTARKGLATAEKISDPREREEAKRVWLQQVDQVVESTGGLGRQVFDAEGLSAAEEK